MTGIGYNIDGMFLSDTDKTKLKNVLKANPPKFLVVLNSIHFAIELKNLLPKTLVAYRRMDLGEYDNLYKIISPAQFVAFHEETISNGLVVYTNNEPSPSSELHRWEFEVAKLILAKGGKSLHYNWSVGMPDYNEYNKMWDLLKLMSQNRDRLFLGLHEYAFANFFFEYGGNDNPVTWENDGRQAHVVGRYKNLVNYCVSNNIKPPSIVFSEYGWDEIHALYNFIFAIPFYKFPHRIPNLIATFEKWKTNSGVGTWEAYAVLMLVKAHDEIYANSKDVYGFCFFPFGGVGAWDAMSAHRYPDFYNALSKFDFSTKYTNAIINESEKHIMGKLGNSISMRHAKWLTSNDVSLNFRENPTTSSAVVVQITDGTEGYVFDEPIVKANGWEWKAALWEINGVTYSGWYAHNYPETYTQTIGDETTNTNCYKCLTQADVEEIMRLLK